jgi:protein-S-isoprenylcysteine O-methyltransferase Ste14
VPIVVIIVFACWWAFVLFWLAMAWRTKRNDYRQPIGQRLAYTLPILIGAWMVFGFNDRLAPLSPLGRRFVPIQPFIGWGAAAIAVAGVALAIWARVTLGRNWSARVTVKEDHALVTSGPYALIRHPIYTALIMLFLAVFLLFGTIGGALGIVLVIASCWIKLRQEEALMTGQFPEAYPAYMGRTARLVPFIV